MSPKIIQFCNQVSFFRNPSILFRSKLVRGSTKSSLQTKIFKSFTLAPNESHSVISSNFSVNREKILSAEALFSLIKLSETFSSSSFFSMSLDEAAFDFEFSASKTSDASDTLLEMTTWPFSSESPIITKEVPGALLVTRRAKNYLVGILANKSTNLRSSGPTTAKRRRKIKDKNIRPLSKVVISNFWSGGGSGTLRFPPFNHDKPRDSARRSRGWVPPWIHDAHSLLTYCNKFKIVCNFHSSLIRPINGLKTWHKYN